MSHGSDFLGDLLGVVNANNYFKSTETNCEVPGSCIVTP